MLPRCDGERDPRPLPRGPGPAPQEHMTTLPDIARAAVAEHRMLPDAASVLAMVSGGADSTALLRLLAAGELGERPLAVLHVDHVLRDESPADAEWVRALCEALGVECRVVRFDVAAYAEEHGLNLEDAGRRVRYRFADEELDALCDRAGVPPRLGRIATAHTLSDSVETFLMRALSGAGAGGLAGVPPARGRIIRPLIGARRDDVIAYLEQVGQDWREDATNADTSRLRARVRHEVVPALAAVQPALHETLGRSLRILADEDALLAEMAEAFARDFAQPAADGSLAFDRALMGTLSRPMARRAVRE
ncbi:MAG: tRNA lysidine(34) synthetase TilS, partial [Actinobacteria bacterium]